VKVRWIAFPLHPEIPEDGMSLQDLFAGRSVIIPEVMQRLKKAAADCGLPFGERTMTYNSRRAQELGKWAESLGVGEDFHQAVFRAYFVDGSNIAKLPVLVELCQSLGLDGREAEKVLLNASFAAEVERDWAYSRSCGITAVPTFLAGSQRVVGAQPYEVLEKLATNTAGAELKVFE